MPTLVVAVDGLGPRAVVELSEAGRLPQITSILDSGRRYRLVNTIPDDPTVLWADLASGHNATDHGVLSAVKPTGEGLCPVTLDDWRIAPVWEDVADTGVSADVINWPASTPRAAGGRTGVTIVSDLEINAEPGTLANASLSRESRLNGDDIPPAMAGALAGAYREEVLGWAEDEPRRRALSAALARAGTIQNAAVDAVVRQGDPAGLVMVRYDLPAVLAQLVLPRPGVFDRGGDVADALRLAVIAGGAELVDTMVGALRQRMPPDTAVLIVGLLDYRIDRPAGAYADKPDPREPNRAIVDRVNGMAFWGETRRAQACLRPGGFAVWHDPGDPLLAPEPAPAVPVKRLHGLLKARYRLPPRPDKSRGHADALVGLDAASRRFEDRHALNLSGPVTTGIDAWRAAVDRRTLNLARAASAHRSWHFAVHAWDLALSRSDRFVYHAMRLEALLNAQRFGRFDRELARWLERVPDQPMLRTLAQARARVQTPPPPGLPAPDRPSPYTRLPERGGVEPERYALWNELNEAALARLHAACQPAADACRQAYSRLETAWSAYAEQRRLPATNQSDTERHNDGLGRALNRHAWTLTGVNSFNDRHGSVNEKSRNIYDCVDQIDAQPRLKRYHADWLQALHRTLFIDADAAPHAGVFRNDNLETGVRMPRIDGVLVHNDPLLDPSYNIPALVDRLLAALRRQLALEHLDPLITAMLAFVSLLKAHPFIDGNGRTSRALLIHLLQHHGYPLVRHIDLPTWFERKREPYLGHCVMLGNASQDRLNDDHQNLQIVLAWLIDLARDAMDQATQCVQRLDPHAHPVENRTAPE